MNLLGVEDYLTCVFRALPYSVFSCMNLHVLSVFTTVGDYYNKYIYYGDPKLTLFA